MDSAGREQNDDAILARIEELLDIKIVSINEVREINLKLDDLFYKGDIDMKTWQTMKKVIHNKYKKMISKTSKIVQENTQRFPIQTKTTGLELHTSFANDFLLEEQLRVYFGDSFFELLSPEEIDLVKQKYSTCDGAFMEQEISFGNKKLDTILNSLRQQQLEMLLGDNIDGMDDIEQRRHRFM